MKEKVDLKSMTKSQIREYIWDYYKWWIILGIAALIFAGSMIYHFATYKKPVATLLLVQVPGDDASAEHVSLNFQDFLSHYEYSAKKNSVEVTDFNDAITNAGDGTALMSIQAMVGGGSGNVILSRNETFPVLADSGCTSSLKDYLPDDELKKHEHDLVYATDEETGDKYPCGIKIEDNAWMKSNHLQADSCIVAFGNVHGHEEGATRLMLYILGDEE